MIESLKELIEYKKSRGKLIVVKDLQRYLEPTRFILKAERDRKTIIFNLKDSVLTCVSNVVYSREDLLNILNVKSDEDLYARITKLINEGFRDSVKGYVDKGFFNLREFSEYFEIRQLELKQLPSIKFYPKDGGEYITSAIIIAEIPTMKAHYNASIHRLMLMGNKGYAVRLVPRHLYNIYKANSSKGLETPIAIVIGVNPALLLLSATSPPYGVFELMGYKLIFNKPLDVALTPKYGIPVPVSASVVMEARITLDLVEEGPFVDLLKLYDRVRRQPLIKVDAIYVNKVYEPYFHVILPGGIEHRIFMGVPREASIWDGVRRVVPNVVKVRLTPGGGSWLNAVIAIRKVSEGEGKLAIMAAFASHPSLKHVVVVDDDIDPDNPLDVEWAIATRFQASKDLVLIYEAKGSTLDPSSKDGITDKLGIDATMPLKERERFIRPTI